MRVANIFIAFLIRGSTAIRGILFVLIVLTVPLNSNLIQITDAPIIMTLITIVTVYKCNIFQFTPTHPTNDLQLSSLPPLNSSQLAQRLLYNSDFFIAILFPISFYSSFSFICFLHIMHERLLCVFFISYSQRFVYGACCLSHRMFLIYCIYNFTFHFSWLLIHAECVMTRCYAPAFHN